MRPCCEEPENRTAPETPNNEKPELTVTVCRVCGANHYELDADAIVLTAEGMGL